jgi:hypothetical protein
MYETLIQQVLGVTNQESGDRIKKKSVKVLD